MEAKIISIGDELLNGQTVNTNAAWLGQQLNALGIAVRSHVVIEDKREAILMSLQSCGDVDWVLMTGGLGPTRDDMTKQVLCEFFDTELVFDATTMERVAFFFKAAGASMSPLNKEQAMLPESCVVLPNSKGTAPGMLFEKGATIYVSLPGVPFEMKYLMEEQVLPRIVASLRGEIVLSHTLSVAGVSESGLSDVLFDFENQLPMHASLAYLPSLRRILLRITVRGEDRVSLTQELQTLLEQLVVEVDAFLVSKEGLELEAEIGVRLREKGQTVALAESCTGGFLSHLMTSVAGCSDYMLGAITAYSNKIKSDVLGVDPRIIEKNTAVSSEVAIMMAKQCRMIFGSDYALAVTGYLGPTGGSGELPLGTVWMALASPLGVEVEKVLLRCDDRKNAIERAAQRSLLMLLRAV